MTSGHKHLWYLVLGFWIVTGTSNGSLTEYSGSCKEMQSSTPDTPSGAYIIIIPSGKLIEVYCEMGLNGGGYTFIHPRDVARISERDIASMFTDNATLLLRVQKTDGLQPYAVLSQLSDYESQPLKISISSYPTNSQPPENLGAIGTPYLHYEFLPGNPIAGLNVNGVRVAYRRCGGSVPASHFVLFPDFKERSPEAQFHDGPAYHGIFQNIRQNPSRRQMPNDFFMFGEIHFSACGCLVGTDQMQAYGVVNIAIGFR